MNRIYSLILDKKNMIKEMLKFSVVGLINTGITLVTIFILAKLLNVNYIVANIIGYLFGLLNSFFMNRSWTFKSSGKIGNQSMRFILVFAVCYLLQLSLLILLKEQMNINEDIAQLVSMVFYTGVNFVLSKFFTFKREIKS